MIANEKTYHFKDFVNLVKFDTYLLNSFEFVSIMFDVGFNEKVFNIQKKQADDFYEKQLAICKDVELAKYACRIYYISQHFN